MPIE
jgi:hypothetical protein